MTIWFTSDTHFGHQNILKYCKRPFSSIEEMDDIIIENWNKHVNPRDVVWHLGDFAFRNSNNLSFYTRRLNGQINLILGNHDNIKKRDYSNFNAIFNGLKEIKIKNQKIVLCHYPLLSWNAAFHGRPHLFGHVHSSSIKNFKCQKNSYDVGVDNNSFCPISFDSVMDILRKEV